jgi:hypothetical protein
MHENLKKMGLDIRKVPLVLQFNKRDLGRKGLPVISLDRMKHELNRQLNVPFFPASAITGEGVGTTLTQTLKLTLHYLQKEFKWA